MVDSVGSFLSRTAPRLAEGCVIPAAPAKES
jgi:hypothetical protein